MIDIISASRRLFRESATLRVDDVVQLVPTGFENSDNDKHQELAAQMKKGIVTDRADDGQTFTADFDGTKIDFDIEDEGRRWKRA